MTRAAKAAGAAPSLPQLSPHRAAASATLTIASRSISRIHRADAIAPRPRVAEDLRSGGRPVAAARAVLYSERADKETRLVEQYARHGCEAWAREGRSSSGSARAQVGLGTRTAHSRGEILKQTALSRCQV